MEFSPFPVGLADLTGSQDSPAPLGTRNPTPRPSGWRGQQGPRAPVLPVIPMPTEAAGPPSAARASLLGDPHHVQTPAPRRTPPPGSPVCFRGCSSSPFIGWVRAEHRTAFLHAVPAPCANPFQPLRVGTPRGLSGRNLARVTTAWRTGSDAGERCPGRVAVSPGTAAGPSPAPGARSPEDARRDLPPCHLQTRAGSRHSPWPGQAPWNEIRRLLLCFNKWPVSAPHYKGISNIR